MITNLWIQTIRMTRSNPFHCVFRVIFRPGPNPLKVYQLDLLKQTILKTHSIKCICYTLHISLFLVPWIILCLPSSEEIAL